MYCGILVPLELGYHGGAENGKGCYLYASCCPGGPSSNEHEDIGAHQSGGVHGSVVDGIETSGPGGGSLKKCS